jgi:hypothetical protein
VSGIRNHRCLVLHCLILAYCIYVYIIGCISHHTEEDNIRIWHLIRIIYRKYFDANVRSDVASSTLLVRFSLGKNLPASSRTPHLSLSLSHVS